MIYILLIIAAVLISAYIVHDANPSIFTPAIHCVKRAWLRYQIEGYKRDIEQIHSQRRNDILAEQAIKREIAAARSQLLNL